MKRFQSVLLLMSVLTILILEFATESSNKFGKEGSACRHRDYGNGATVCVCTVNYCDNLGHVNLESVPFGSIATLVTSKDGDRFKMEIIDPKLDTSIDSTLADVSIEINRQTRHQKIIGFGGSFTDSTGFNIDKLEPKLAERLIQDYYGSDGIEYNMGRVPIGGCDFSTRPYSYDDNAGFEDPELKHFQLQWEDLQFKIPYLKMAAQFSPRSVKYMASPWSPPAWMKTNNKLNNGGSLIGKPGGKYYQLYAKYLVRFLREYNQHNISIWALTMENEPVSGRIPIFPWNSLDLNATMQRDFLKLDLGPALQRAGYSDLKMFIFDDSLPEIEQYVGTVLDDPEAARYTTGIAYHWYHNLKYPDREPLDRIYHNYSGKYSLLSTEASHMLIGHSKFVPLGDWEAVNLYAVDIIKDLNHWTSAWIDWNMVLDRQGGPNWAQNHVDAPIIVNENGAEYYKQPYFYAMGHFSKLLIPDSIRLDQTVQFGNKISNHSSIESTTFLRPDNRTVLTVLNTNQKEVKIRVQDNGPGTKNNSFQLLLKPNSLSSIIWY